MVLTPLAAWCGGGEVYPVEELAGGSCYLGFARFGSALAGPAEAAINPAGLAYALYSDFIGTATAAPFLNNALYACYGLNIVKPMRTESAALEKVRTIAALGISLHQLDQGTVNGRDDQGNRTGREYRTSQSLAAVSLGMELEGFGALGFNLKVLTVTTGERSDSGFGVDLGLMLRPGDFRMGLCLVNLIPPGISLAERRTFAQRVLRLGLGCELFGNLTPVIEAVYLPGTGSHRYGFNLLYVPWSAEEGRLALGGGYDLENERWGAMFLLRMGFIELVYSRYDMDLIGLCHSIRLAFSPEF